MKVSQHFLHLTNKFWKNKKSNPRAVSKKSGGCSCPDDVRRVIRKASCGYLVCEVCSEVICDKGIFYHHANTFQNRNNYNSGESVMGSIVQGHNTYNRSQKWATNSIDNSLYLRQYNISTICSQQKKPIPRNIVRSACQLFKMIHAHKKDDGIRRGGPLTGYMAACLKYAAKEAHVPLKNELIIKMFFFNEKIREEWETATPKHRAKIIESFKPHLTVGMNYLNDLIFYQKTREGSIDSLSTSKQRLIRVKNYINAQFRR